ncbi:MAG: LysR family transcriptional regulator substrate-binding protein, partial [Treponemataceae bacterium]
YKAKYPNISIDLYENTSAELENMITNGTVDLAIMPLPFNNPTICFHPFLSSRMVLIVSKNNPLNSFAYDKGLGEKRYYFNLKQAANEPFIIGNRGQRIRAVTELIFKRAEISPRIALYSKNIETIKNIAATGVGLAIIPEQYLKENDTGFNANTYYLEADQDFSWTIAAAFANSSYLSPAATQFIHVLREHMTEKEASVSDYVTPCGCPIIE